MQNWLTASGFTNKNLDIDTLFADVWCKRMQTAVRSIAFSDRWHFLKVFCQNVKWEAYDNAKKAMEDPVLPSPEEHSRNETDPARLVEIAEDAESLERLIQQLHVAIGDLPTDCRTAIEYHFFDDKTFRQIGSELNLSWSAVKKRVDKASALLQSTLSSSS